MCGNCFRIKVCNRFAPNKVAVKCGICKECRQIEQNSWSFRLRCELEDRHSKGWKIGFLTLTYSDENLPHIPLELADLSKCPQYHSEGPVCFNKSQVRDFVVSLRKSLYDTYNIGSKHIEGIRYLICSEYGKSTKRPHYHAVFCWPPVLDACDFFDLVKSKWRFGFVFPKEYNGGYDSHHYYHQPFEVLNNPSYACKYIAKYICKDLDFFDSLKDFYPSESADLSNYFPFHLQSRSLGFSRFCGLSDNEKLDIITKGFSFVGEDKLLPIPLYVKRKLWFSPLYVVEREIYQNGRKVNVSDIESSFTDDELSQLGFSVKYHRLVRRQATDFFKRHYVDLYNRQLSTYTKLFEPLFNSGFLKSRGISEINSCDFVNFLSANPAFSSAKSLAESYLCYYGLPIHKCFNIEPSLQWFLRYDSLNEFDVTGFSCLDSDYYDSVNFYVQLLVNLCICSRLDYSEKDKLVAAVSDFWKSAI